MDTLLKVVKQLPLLCHPPGVVLMLRYTADTLVYVLFILIDIQFMHFSR